MGVHGDRNSQIAIAEHLDQAMALLEQALGGEGFEGQFLKAFGVKLRDAAQVHHRVFGAEDVGEAALRQAAMQRHLSTFKATHHVGAGTRTLSLVASGRSLAHARAHTAADTLFVAVGLLGSTQIRKILCHYYPRSTPDWLNRSDSHLFLGRSYLTIRTRCGTVLTMPRMEAVSSRSTT